MTAPEPTAVERALAKVLIEHDGWDGLGRGVIECVCGWRSESLGVKWNGRKGERHHAHVAEAVVAAIRNLPPEQMAELTGGEVQAGYHWGARFYPSGADDEIDAVRVVTPWREVTGSATPARDLTPGVRDDL